MRRIVALAVAFSMFLPAVPLVAAARTTRALQGQTASLAGKATSSTGQVLPNTKVQLRNIATGELAGTTTSSATGEFKFQGIPPGNYTIEIVSSDGRILATSASITLIAGTVVTGVTVIASAATIAAGAGVAGTAGAVAAGAGAGAAGISTAVIIAIVAGAAGVAGAVAIAANGDASPVR